MLEGKKILLGISGSIAAYKTAALTRLFVKAGAEVKVILTPSAKDFVTPVTLATLSKNPVNLDFIKGKNGEWTNHVELGLWADLFLIAPATANTVGKMAHGICDNLLLATYLSARCKVVIAPAMDLDMFAHPSTQKNLQALRAYGNEVIEPNSGELASGLLGKGRMPEPEELFAWVQTFFTHSQLLSKVKVLITAGPTYEHIDPVRFIGNHSSGKMGYALAEQLANCGAEVILVSGPSQLKTHHQNIQRVNVNNAADMLKACLDHFPKSKVAILSAAVADYTPEEVSANKIKKSGDTLLLKLKKTEDILKKLGTIKKKKQLLVGFALETNNEESNAMKKLQEKNLDFIVLNSLKDKGAGFGFDTNQVTIIHKNGNKIKFGLKTKHEVAKDIVDQIIQIIHA
jgi:phosphopantothenoylcysteine decarboxylase/phosphopantothenate--cysteine ligase